MKKKRKRIIAWNKLNTLKGAVPGTLISSENIEGRDTKINIINYNKDNYIEKGVQTISESMEFINKHSVTWINIDSILDTDIIKDVGNKFKIHPLILEDISNPTTRPKIEDYGTYIFVSSKMLYLFEENIAIENVSLILGENYVISFQERKGDVFDAIRDRIRKNKGFIRTMYSDYLIFALLDAIIDNYFYIIENLSDRIEETEDILLSNPSTKTLHEIHDIKRNIIIIKKAVYPLREVISILERAESSLIKNKSNVFYKSIYVHVIQIMDAIESIRDVISDMKDMYLSIVSNRMNEVMKTLTIIATIFIPLTFIAGIYGMNFKNMPELEWGSGYYIVLLVMLIVVILMLIFFRRKKWI